MGVLLHNDPIARAIEVTKYITTLYANKTQVER